jgi:hypothetical protein
MVAWVITLVAHAVLRRRPAGRGIRHPVSVRINAVRAFLENQGKLRMAVARLRVLCSQKEYNRIRNKAGFIRNNSKKFLKYGTVLDRVVERVHSKQPMVPDDVARQAAALVKAGYKTEVEVPLPGPLVGTEKIQLQLFYGSITEAAEREPRLAAILKKYDVSSHQLLQRMCAVDPSMARRVVHFKMAHTYQQRYARQQQAAANLQAAEADPNWLQRIVWVDECCIWLVPGNQISKKVWVDAHDKRVHAVIPCPLLGSSKPVKVRVIAAVNYHLGAFFLEFTTGTHGLTCGGHRLHILEKVYKVRRTAP